MANGTSPYRRASPPHVAEHDDLGAFVREHRGRRDLTGVAVLIGLPLIGALIGQSRAASVSDTLVAGAVGLALGLVFFAVTSLFHRRTIVRVYEDGVVVTRRRVTHALRYDSVDRLYLGMQSRRIFVVARVHALGVRITRHDGTDLDLRNAEVTGLRELAERLERRCSDPIIPDARAAVDAGETLDFGPLVIDREEARIGSASAPWREIDHAVVRLDQIEFHRAGRLWRTVRFEHLAHRTVVLALLAKLTHLREGPGAHMA